MHNFVSQWFLFSDQYVKHKVIDVFIEREDGSLGIVLRGGAHPDPEMCKPLTVTHVRSDGPADRWVQIQSKLCKSYKLYGVEKNLNFSRQSRLRVNF